MAERFTQPQLLFCRRCKYDHHRLGRSGEIGLQFAKPYVILKHLPLGDNRNLMSEHLPYCEGSNRHKTELLSIPPIKRNATLIVSWYCFLCKGLPCAASQRKEENTE